MRKSRYTEEQIVGCSRSMTEDADVGAVPPARHRSADAVPLEGEVRWHRRPRRAAPEGPQEESRTQTACR